MSKRKRTTEEIERKAKIRELLQISKVGSMQVLQKNQAIEHISLFYAQYIEHFSCIYAQYVEHYCFYAKLHP